MELVAIQKGSLGTVVMTNKELLQRLSECIDSGYQHRMRLSYDKPGRAARIRLFCQRHPDFELCCSTTNSDKQRCTCRSVPRMHHITEEALM